MRRVNIKTGLKQRINEILGTDFGAETSTGAYDITPWSIQAAMLSNVCRIGKSIVGEAAQGRVMKGLSISYYGPGNNIKITQGYGFTPEGNVVTLGKDLIIPITQTSGYVYIYLKYILDVATESTPMVHDYGKNTSFNSETGTKEIVYDDKALIFGSTITRDIIEVSTEEKSGEDGFIYLGKISLDGVLDADSVITNTTDIGIIPVPAAIPDSVIIEKIILSGTFTDGKLKDITLPVNYTHENTIILSFKVKGDSDIFPIGKWLVIPYSRFFNGLGDQGVTTTTISPLLVPNTINISCFLSNPSTNLYQISVRLEQTINFQDPVIDPTFENVDYQIVIGRIS
jgi:hypothetical protein